MHINDLDTPSLVIDLDRVETNIHKLQSYCDFHNIKSRPHIKTHKLPVLAYKQLETGAVGITCQKLSEALVMAAAGIKDILITYNIIGKQKLEPLVQLARQTKLSIAIDNEVALNTNAQAAHLAKTNITLLFEFESGNERVGVQSPQEALELAQKIQQHPFLKFEGLMTYPCSKQAATFITKAKGLFANVGLEINTVSAGGTPGMWTMHEVAGITELRAGTYIYNDRNIVGSGTATLETALFEVPNRKPSRD